MDNRISISFRTLRNTVAALAAAVLVTGAAWHGLAADSVAASRIATVTSPITHAVAGGRDSYADRLPNVDVPNERARVYDGVSSTSSFGISSRKRDGSVDWYSPNTRRLAALVSRRRDCARVMPT